MLKVILLSILQIAAWVPYYSWGLGKFRDYLNNNLLLPGLAVVLLSLIPGYLGLWIAYKFLKLDPTYFRLIAVATAQLSGASVIAVVSNFNGYVIAGLLLILIGAVLTTLR